MGSEPFGHARGAFSETLANRRGQLALAQAGTLFLNEEGQLPPAAHPSLSRVLQGGQLHRMGSNRDHAVDVRAVVATSRSLGKELLASHAGPAG